MFWNLQLYCLWDFGFCFIHLFTLNFYLFLLLCLCVENPMCHGRVEGNAWESIISYSLVFWHLNVCFYLLNHLASYTCTVFHWSGVFLHFTQMTPQTRKAVAHPLHNDILK